MGVLLLRSKVKNFLTLASSYSLLHFRTHLKILILSILNWSLFSPTICLLIFAIYMIHLTLLVLLILKLLFSQMFCFINTRPKVLRFTFLSPCLFIIGIRSTFSTKQWSSNNTCSVIQSPILQTLDRHLSQNLKIWVFRLSSLGLIFQELDFKDG